MVGDRVVFNTPEPGPNGMSVRLWEPVNDSVTVLHHRRAVVTDGASLAATINLHADNPCTEVLDTADGNKPLRKRCNGAAMEGFSPDGTYALLDSGGKAEFANPRTGEVIERYPWKFNAWQTRWESDGTVLLNALLEDRDAILRLSPDDGTRQLATTRRDDPGGVDGLNDPPYNLGTPSAY